MIDTLFQSKRVAKIQDKNQNAVQVAKAGTFVGARGPRDNMGGNMLNNMDDRISDFGSDMRPQSVAMPGPGARQNAMAGRGNQN